MRLEGSKNTQNAGRGSKNYIWPPLDGRRCSRWTRRRALLDKADGGLFVEVGVSFLPEITALVFDNFANSSGRWRTYRKGAAGTERPGYPNTDWGVNVRIFGKIARSVWAPKGPNWPYGGRGAPKGPIWTPRAPIRTFRRVFRKSALRGPRAGAGSSAVLISA